MNRDKTSLNRRHLSEWVGFDREHTTTDALVHKHHDNHRYDHCPQPARVPRQSVMMSLLVVLEFLYLFGGGAAGAQYPSSTQS